MLQTTSSSEAELPEFLSCSRRDRSNFFPMISLRVACLTVRTIFGVYNLNFFVELSDLPTFGVPQDNFTPQGNLLLGSQIANSDMDIFQGIDACLSPTQRLCGVSVLFTHRRGTPASISSAARPASLLQSRM